MRITPVLPRLSRLAIKDEKEWAINTPWGKLTALSWGDPSNKPVLLCHGRLDACSGFRPLVQNLPKEYFYVSLDLPGNGRSDHFPRGSRLILTDFVPALERLRDHFEWKNFMYIGHSLGAALGKVLNQVHPGQITKLVDLDPQPAYSPPKDFRKWYNRQYRHFFGDQEYEKTVSGKETAPRYTYEQARERMMKARNLSGDVVEHVLERSLEPAEDGLFRYTYDQRFKSLVILPFLYESLQEFYTSPATPTLAIFASQSVERGFFKYHPFSLNDSEWKNRNYKHIVVDGGHDLHLEKPKEVASHIANFMNRDHVV